LPLVEFSFNNSCQATIKIVTFDALYGRKCRTPFCWNNLDDILVVGSEMIPEMVDKVKVIQQNMRKAQDR